MKRRTKVIGCLGPLLIGFVAVVIVVIAAWPPSGKYDPSSARVEPTSEPQPTQPHLQFESHTCGFLAMTAVYEAYGIDADAADIRFRLGVDRPGVPFANDTLGTLHPDMLRVLAQDGFRTEIVDLESDNAEASVTDHLTRGDHAIVLEVRETTGNLHWVVLNGDTEPVTITDSLVSEPYDVALPTYLAERVLSVILISDADDESPTPDVVDLHAQGITEMGIAFRRVDDRDQRSSR